MVAICCCNKVERNVVLIVKSTANAREGYPGPLLFSEKLAYNTKKETPSGLARGQRQRVQGDTLEQQQSL
jgi:hypothetical protein